MWFGCAMPYLNIKMRVTLISLSLVLLFSCAEETDTVKWYRMSADQGDAQAQFNLGLMYANGTGVTQDYKEAVKWCRMAAEQGHAKAQFLSTVMVVCNNFGLGMPQDSKEAYALLSVAKTNGDDSAEKNLDIMEKKMTKDQIADAMSLATEIQNRIKANR